MADLNRIAIEHIGMPVTLGEFNITFEAKSAQFKRSGEVLRIEIAGTYSDLRKFARTQLTSDEIEMELKLIYKVDIRHLDQEIGITTADSREIIELHCAGERACVRLDVLRDGQKIALPDGMDAGVLAGFSRSENGSDRAGRQSLISAIRSAANLLRIKSGLAPIGD